MRNRALPVTLAAVVAATLSLPAFLVSQTSPGAKTTGSAPAASKTATKATAAKTPDAKPWKQIYLPNGQPDLQGIYTNISFTPMERPAKYGSREFLTATEEDADYKAGVQHSYEYTYGNTADSPFYDSTAYGLDAWQQGVQPNPRSSLIVDPADGHFPPLTAAAAAARRPRGGGGGGGNVPRADSAKDQSTGVRCLVFGGPPMLPSVTNSDMKIVQGDNAVFVEWEWDSSPRIIKLNDTAPPLPADVHLWRGDSRGHWEGNTLVAVTTNLYPGFVYGGANADTTKITEYFTRINQTTVEYKFTVDDPSTWIKPWTAIVPFSHINGPMQEYACEEGNFSMVEILQAGREADKEKAAGPAGVNK